MNREGPGYLFDGYNICKRTYRRCKYYLFQRGGAKGAVEEEAPTIDFAFATVVTIANIKAGDKFTKENIWVKRPGTGEIFAKDYNSIIGMTATRDIAIDEHLCKADII